MVEYGSSTGTLFDSNSNKCLMIRPTLPADTPTLLTIAERTKVFKPLEQVALREVLNDYHESPQEHQCYTEEAEGVIRGMIYFAPAAMTDRVWYLYWIFVNKDIQAKGRLILIETSGLPYYELTRQFYLKHGYELHAEVKDFYEDGDNLRASNKMS